MPTNPVTYLGSCTDPQGKVGKEMISMPTVNSIHQLKREGASVSEISKKLGISRNTVYAYLRKTDFSPELPVKRRKPSKLDPYKPVIDSWLEDDRRNWRKQRHSATRIWRRLVDELGADVGQSTVRNYGSKKRAASRPEAGYLDLTWAPGECQADFGEADFYVDGVRQRLSFFVMTFPFSNVGLAQVFPGENSECVCQALKNIFEYVGGVPSRIVFDNATGVGRRTCDAVRTASLFRSFAAHYGFGFSFCNPNSGNEKGNVENKVGFIRRNLMVPVPQISSAKVFNRNLLDRCMQLSDKAHWIKGEPESQLFVEDRVALSGLPRKPFEVVRYAKVKTDKKGKARVDGNHFYSTSPEHAQAELTAALGATTVEFYDADGVFVCRHRRAYGKAVTDTSSPASQLALLCLKPGGWRNSRVRSALSDDLRAYMDSLGKDELKRDLRLMRNESSRSGWEAMVEALESSFSATGRIDEAAVCVGAMRAASGVEKIAYDEPVDLSVYDGIANAKAVV